MNYYLPGRKHIIYTCSKNIRFLYKCTNTPTKCKFSEMKIHYHSCIKKSLNKIKKKSIKNQGIDIFKNRFVYLFFLHFREQYNIFTSRTPQNDLL